MFGVVPSVSIVCFNIIPNAGSKNQTLCVFMLFLPFPEFFALLEGEASQDLELLRIWWVL